MAKFLSRIPCGRIAFLGMFERNYDKVLTPGYDELTEEKPVGIKGIVKAFSPDKYGHFTPEFSTMSAMSAYSFIFSGALGAFLQSKEAWLNFMQNNQATQFTSHFHAQKTLQGIVTLAIGKGALKYGIKIGGFSTIFIVCSTAISAYNGKSGFIEYLGAGVFTGCLFKMNMGIKGAIAGSIIGGIIGSIAGIGSTILLFCTGFSMDDIRQNQYELSILRREYGNKALTKDSDQNVDKFFTEIDNTTAIDSVDIDEPTIKQQMENK